MPSHPGAKFKVDGSQLHAGKKQLYTAAASWCGYSQKQNDAIKASQHADHIKVIMCDKAENKDHAVCKKQVTGYPATFNSLVEGSTPCHMGYDKNVNNIVAKCNA